jgi:membrane protein required for colicin V production
LKNWFLCVILYQYLERNFIVKKRKNPMVLNIVRHINWIDILAVIILFRISYIAIKNGLGQEIFKFLGILLALYLSLHYYSSLSDFMARRIGLKSASGLWLNFIIFIFSSLVGYLIFVILRKIFWRFIKFEPVFELNKWGGFILGVCRAILVISLIGYILAISPAKYFRHSIQNSYSGKKMFKIAPATYAWLWNKIVSKFMITEKFNLSVSEVQKDLLNEK